MTPLIEACARALYEDFRSECIEEMVDWELLPDKDTWRQRCRAVIPLVLAAAAEVAERECYDRPDGKRIAHLILALKPDAGS